MFGQSSDQVSSAADSGPSEDLSDSANQVKKMQQVETYEVPEDNPISAMIALKHPE